MFEDEEINYKVVTGTVGKGTQKQRKRAKNKKTPSQLFGEQDKL